MVRLPRPHRGDMVTAARPLTYPLSVRHLGPNWYATVMGTAVVAFADVAPGVVPEPYSEGFGLLAVLYGVPVMGFALLWFLLAAALVLRARRHGMRFSMTWWSFTFPVGTCVTGAEALGRHTGLLAYAGPALVLYAVLVAAWGTAVAGTVRGLLRGELLAAPGPGPAAPRPVTVRTTSGAVRRRARRAGRGRPRGRRPR